MVSLGLRRALPLIAALFLALCACAASRSQESTEPHIADSAITARVKAALAAEPRVRALFINVDTSNGIVRLTGFADNRLEADQAVTVANSIAGVKRVQDDIVVRVSRDRRK